MTAEPLLKATTVGASVQPRLEKRDLVVGKVDGRPSRPSASYWPGKPRNNTTTSAVDAASRAQQ